ncbi:MAG: hypothetical protein H6978_07310 [Gammaproteobacteria bacterium]|nr:hypothetical protein [Gammaproteobacteria bacterium]
MHFRLLLAATAVAMASCQNDVAPPPSSIESVVADAACDRACLESVIENYLQALAAHDPSRIELTDDVIFSEDSQRMAVGDGSWRTMTGTGSYRHYFADPQAQQVAVISTMRENGQGVIYDLRLRLRDKRIAEIESMVIRSPGGAQKYEELGGPPPNFVDIIPVAQRNTRDELLALPFKYLNGMENNDPDGDYSFFDPQCNRYEHALKTTNSEPKHVGHTESTSFSTMTCEAQFSGGGLAFVTRIRDERYHKTMVVDEEKQAIFGFVYLDHNGTVRSITRRDGTESLIPPYFSTPRSLKVGEAWRVRDHKLFEIEMTLTETPYGTRPQFGLDGEDSAWLASRNINPDGLQVPDSCDQSCLDDLTRQFLSALINHDASTLPLAPDVRYRENGVPLAVGDGLWGTATALGEYRVLLNDPEAGVAGYFGTITETNVPGLLAARISIADGLIDTIDVTVMRHEYSTARGGTLSLFYPQLEGMFEPDAFSTMEPALLQTASATIPASTRQHADAAVRDSSILVADVARGLVLRQAITDVTNDAGAEASPVQGSYSVVTTTLDKFSGNDVVLSRSLAKPVPYRMPWFE